MVRNKKWPVERPVMPRSWLGLVVAGDRSDAKAIAAVHCDIRMEGSCGLLTDREVRPDDVDGVAHSARLASSRAAPADGSVFTDGRWNIARLIAGNSVIPTWIRRPGT